MADDKSNTGAAATGRGTQQAENTLRQGADQLRNQMGNMADVAGMSAKVSQELIQRSGQNFEMMKRIAETMTSGARSAAGECAEYAKHSAKRQSEMMQQLASARSPNDVLDIQNRYLQDNLKELLNFSERLSRLSAEKAKEAGERLDQKG
ncbi:phasin family protein [Skermanella pratensis]|uniref:phasin family protein n=1 Tax=Skermanella pratensis TaxID=2233999 RepID=UPI00130139A0|nr:phasin family protein [Skermanella pratensis]